MSNVICTAYVIDQDGFVYDLHLTYGDYDDGVSINDHVDWVIESMLMGDELLNVVIY